MIDSLQTKISSFSGSTPTSIRPLSGGSVGEVYRADFQQGPPWVVKIHQGDHPNLDIEAYMLTYLREHSSLPVPHVYHSTTEILVMEWMEGESVFSQHAEIHAAQLLSSLHQISAPQFGLEQDTLIGSLHQPNTQNDNWISFFCEHRLLHMAQKALQENRMDLDTMSRIEKFCSNLDKWLLEPEYPSLLHGDVWTTNVLSSNNQVTGFLDPAVYYGHPEIELAFITLFNTFGDIFFDAYHQSRPIKEGFFEERKDIYNMYPLLVHARLFGGSYLRSVENILSRFGY